MVCPQHNIETKPEVSSDARQLLTIVVVCCADATFGPGRREAAERDPAGGLGVWSYSSQPNGRGVLPSRYPAGFAGSTKCKKSR